MIKCIKLELLPFYCSIVLAIQAPIENGHAEDLDKPFILHNDLNISLIASEPDIVDPVALAFDHDCQLYVVEMRDYPNGVPKKNKGGSIKLLTDSNGLKEYYLEGDIFMSEGYTA